MFAPHCTGCHRRVLLGPGRIVHTARPGVLLRCFCGELVAWDQGPPRAQAEPRADPALAGASAPA
jgi:hypothetical protein